MLLYACTGVQTVLAKQHLCAVGPVVKRFRHAVRKKSELLARSSGRCDACGKKDAGGEAHAE